VQFRSNCFTHQKGVVTGKYFIHNILFLQLISLSSEHCFIESGVVGSIALILQNKYWYLQLFFHYCSLLVGNVEHEKLVLHQHTLQPFL
jgi:hypothetical protein